MRYILLNKKDTKEDVFLEIKEIMKRNKYSQVTKELYHKQKKKVEHNVWRIGKDYYYFLKQKGDLK